MRLIDADALYKFINDASSEDDFDISLDDGVRFTMEAIIDAPTIEPNLVINPEEVAEGRVIEIGEDIIVMHHKDYYDMFLKSELYNGIVLCGECRFCKLEGDDEEGTHYLWCWKHDLAVDGANFCSWGERSDDA